MSRKAMILLLIAILAVHIVLLSLFLATDSAEHQLNDTRRELEEENALRSAWDQTQEAASKTDLTAQTVSAQPAGTAAQSGQQSQTATPARTATTKPTTASSSNPTQTKPVTTTTQIAVSSGEEKKIPSVPSTTYVRKPRKMTPAKLDFTGAARDNSPGLKLIDRATAGILVDMDTNKVLWAKNPSKPVPIASLSKIMTIMLTYEIAMDNDSPYTLESLIPVTTEAINTEASKVYFKKGEMFTLRELLVAASVRSANDAAHLMAQHLGGGKAETFIEDMNRRAVEIDMTHTTFRNAHGLPGKSKALDNQSSPEDVARLCLLFRTYPYLMELAGLRTAPFREKSSPDYILLQNHNNLLPGAKTASPGVNGIKTGFTNRAGFCVAASCERSGRHLLAVVMGFPSQLDRDNFVRVLLDWGYAKIGVGAAKKSSAASTTTKKSGR